ncbi:acyltransferase [Streptomyces sp. UNOB3_S3]|uniref:acyltransferase family protein n=1 Tax=Streptomyces sp. UNOB3_S3 TaxID=2871682 RepID=UPI001E5618A2|nr:acyltransferase [Streptomyces sp. UNOB3_S3]MCC3776014.1 acyltransferase [Streptomyces sp. UNOB3_S3]
MTVTSPTSAPSLPAPRVEKARARSSGRLYALDGLRLVAALMVALYHYGGRDGDVSRAWGASPRHEFPHLSAAFAYGCLGVQIFFVISGFVICMSGWGRPLRSFFASRAARLYPAYWAAIVLVTLVFALPWVTYRTVSPSDTLVNLSMLQQPVGADRVLGVCWTLWAELRFYALFALFVVLPGASRRRVVLFCAVWTLMTVITSASHVEFLRVVFMPEHSAFFIGGIGLYLVHRFGNDALAWGIVGVSFLLGQHYAVAGLVHPPNPHYFSTRSAYVVIAVLALGYAAVAAVATGRTGWATWRWLPFAGALTYPFYLVHEHLGWVVIGGLHRGLGIPSYATFALTLLVMLVLAWALHRFVERRFTPMVRKALDGGASLGGQRG